MNRFLITLSIVYLICISTVSGQQNLIYQVNRNYQKGIELFEKQKYGAAYKYFRKVIDDNFNVLSLQKSDAEYYSVLCAIKLNNDDAENLLDHFVKNNPESQYINNAWFEMAKHLYSKKSYKNACVYFEKVNKYLLTGDEKAELFFKKGYCYFQLKDYSEARVAFYEIKDIDTKYTSPAIYYYSHIAYIQKNYETALNGFLRLTTDENFSKIVPYYITQCYYYQDRFDDLIAYALPIIDSVVENRAAEMAKLIGDAYYNKNQFKEATPYLERFHKNEKNISAGDNYEMAYCYYQAAKYKESVPYFEKASMGDSILEQNSMYHLADCYIRLNEKNKARMAFEGAAKLDNNKDIKQDALFNCALITYELSYTPFNDAVKAFNDYLTLYPESKRTDEALNYLSQAYLMTKNYKEALISIEKIKKKDQTIKKAFQRISFFRALELFNDSRFQEAIETLNVSLKYATYDPNLNARAYYWIGESQYRLINYKEALVFYNQFLLSSRAIYQPEYNIVHYDIAYIYFYNKNYENANSWFRKYIGLEENKQSAIFADACNRIGDCYFKNTQYENAIEYYNKAIGIGKSNKDYSTFQKAFSLGLLNKHSEKVSLLYKLTTESPQSPYVGDAIYEIGRSQMIMQKNEDAIQSFKKLISDIPSSSYVKKALLQLGLIYFNLDKNTEAMDYYKQVVTLYPGTPESKSALTGIKNIFVEMNDVDGYIKYADKLPEAANITLSEQDSLTYMAAEKIFMQGDCQNSKESFKKYIDKFANGNFILNANFYKAECNYKDKEYDEALVSYEFVISKPKNVFTESALIGAARINFNNKSFAKAVENYKMLESIGENNNNIMEARIGLMRAYHNLNEYQKTIEAAQQVLNFYTDKLSPENKREAIYLIAKSYLDDTRPIPALEEFKTLAAEVKSPEGAEAKYRIAEIYFSQQEYDKSEKEAMQFINMNTPQQYWLARSFILLSDIFIKKNDPFQAIQTLKSIIDNYEDKKDGIIDTANTKLKLISEQSNKKDTIQSAEPEIRVP